MYICINFFTTLCSLTWQGSFPSPSFSSSSSRPLPRFPLWGTRPSSSRVSLFSACQTPLPAHTCLPLQSCSSADSGTSAGPETLCVWGGGGEEIVEICINTCHYTDRYIYMYLQCIYERKKEGNRRPGKCTDPKQKVNYRKKTLSRLGQDSNQRTPKFCINTWHYTDKNQIYLHVHVYNVYMNERKKEIEGQANAQIQSRKWIIEKKHWELPWTGFEPTHS